MGKLTKGRLGLVAVVAASALGLPSVACNHVVHSNSGSVALTVTVPAKAQVDELSYVVTGNGIMPIAGSVKTARPQEVFDELISNIPAGENYELAVSAKSTDKRFLCKRTAQVSVHKNAITRVHLDLECMTTGEGRVVITVALACSGGVHLVSYSVEPLSASIGGLINLTATALDADAGTLHYAWSAPFGDFADPSAPQTTYRCSIPGRITLNLIAASDLCQESQDIEVECLGPEGVPSQDASVDAPAGP